MAVCPYSPLCQLGQGAAVAPSPRQTDRQTHWQAFTGPTAVGTKHPQLHQSCAAELWVSLFLSLLSSHVGAHCLQTTSRVSPGYSRLWLITQTLLSENMHTLHASEHFHLSYWLKLAKVFTGLRGNTELHPCMHAEFSDTNPCSSESSLTTVQQAKIPKYCHNYIHRRLHQTRLVISHNSWLKCPVKRGFFCLFTYSGLQGLDDSTSLWKQRCERAQFLIRMLVDCWMSDSASGFLPEAPVTSFLADSWVHELKNCIKYWEASSTGFCQWLSVSP